MLVINILSGPQAGQTVELKPGRTVIGRSATADVQIKSANISKEHAVIEFLADKIIISDLKSTNGTFVNGVKIQSQRLKSGDKILLYKILIEVAEIPDFQRGGAGTFTHSGNPGYHQTHTGNPQNPAPGIPGHTFNGNAAMQYQYPPQYQQHPFHPGQPHAVHAQNESAEPQTQAKGFVGFIEKAQNYIDEVLMPGVYKLPELIEFKWVLILFMVAFIMIVTSLSTIPLVRILKSSIEKESQQRALTIARSLARANRTAIMNKQDSIVSVEVAEKESGVEQAMIIKASNGEVIAPPRLMGQFPDTAFIHVGRKTDKEGVEQIDDATIGAMAPIKFYNPASGNYSVQAFAVVIYGMGSMAINDSRTLSLFIQTLFLALIVGGILFFFIYKLIEHPILTINSQLDEALKEGKDNVQSPYEFPALNKLTTNINSALTKILTGTSGETSGPIEHDRNPEMQNLTQLIGFGAIAISVSDRSITSINDTFAEKTNLNPHEVIGMSLAELTDQALKLNLEDLVSRAQMTPDQLVTNELEIGGVNHELIAQSVFGLQSVSYVLIALIPLSEEGY
ncbi:MAG: FHA domain-containing protein [Bdellovibrionales bacterium]|nr:FHA domain-containing protein [Bdellovibrionales bacterium]